MRQAHKCMHSFWHCVLWMCLSTGCFNHATRSEVISPKSMPATEDVLVRLSQAQGVNLDEILTEKLLLAPNGKLKNPYTASDLPLNLPDSQVCAMRWDDGTFSTYHLKNFASHNEAQAKGYQLTHHKACGACSGLQDLSVYLSTTDLTTPVRRCASKWFFPDTRIKACLMEEVGFTDRCADAWLYNILHTRDVCFDICVEEYGWGNLILGRFPAQHNLSSGALTRCVQCDEERSGPGFKYAAGRTRRNSGIVSAIQRGTHEIQAVDHTQYFPPNAPVRP